MLVVGAQVRDAPLVTPNLDHTMQSGHQNLTVQGRDGGAEFVGGMVCGDFWGFGSHDRTSEVG